MQASPSTTNGLFEFGPFRVDAQKRVLLRRGEPIPLTPKAFETLLVLIQNNGQPVPKDDLMRTLWPDSFVEEGNLTQNIFVLRKALGSNNRYIVTIPGRGYQFVEPVRQIAENPEALNGETQFHPPAGVRLARHSMLHRHLWLGLGAAVCLCAILGLFAYRRRVRLGQAKTSAPAGLVRRSVAVLGFQNLSRRQANDWLSTAIGEMLTTELAAGQQIRTVPGEDVSRMKISLALADADTYNRTTLGRIRSNVHTDDVVFGSYVPLSGGQIRIDVRVQDTAKGELLAAISEKGSEANVDDLVIRTGAALRKAFATAPVTPAEAATVAASMPVDAQAAKLYASGLAKLRLLDNLGARDLLQQALAIEPTFAPGHLAMSQVWSNLGYDQKAREEAGKAFDNAGRLSRPEQLRIEARYRLTNQEWGKAVDISRSLFEFFPDSLDDGLLLAQAQAHAGKFSDALGTVDQLRANSLFSDEPMLNLEESEIAGRMGDFRREVSSALRAIQQAQRQGSRLINAAAERDACSGYLRLGQKEDAKKLCEDSRTTFASLGDRNNEAGAMLYLARIAYDTGNPAAAIRMMEQTLEVARSTGNAGATANGLIYLGNFLDTQGDPIQAESRYEEAAQICRSTANKNLLAYALSNAAIVAHRLGNLAAAEQMYAEVTPILEEGQDMAALGQTDMNLGHIFWAKGDLQRAQHSYDQALSIFEKFGELADRATVRADLALVALHRGELKRAETLIDAAHVEAETSNDLIAELHVDSVRARILLTRKEFDKAQQQIQEARSLVDKVPDDQERIYFSINAAQVGAASGNAADVAHAKQTLATLAAQARDATQTENQFEALLALGAVQFDSGEVAAGRATLNGLKHDAESRGFRLIAQDADSKLSGAAVYQRP